MMNAGIDWVLANLHKAAGIITHYGHKFTVAELREVMLDAQSKGHQTIKDIPDADIDAVLAKMKKP